MYNYRYWFGEAVKRIRSEFPLVKVISPGLAKNSSEWWYVCKDEFAKADFVGFHSFGDFDFRGENEWNAQVIGQLTSYFRTNSWFCTEYGINGQRDPQRTKGTKYAGMVHFSESDPSWPSNAKGAVYFHLDTRDPNIPPKLGGAERPQYVIYFAGGDDAYRERKEGAVSASDRLGINERLDRGAPPLSSLDGRYKLYLQAGDGNLVLYNAAGVAIWSTYRPGGDFLVLQPDANLVVYRNTGEALWNAGTYGSGADALVLQNDGNLVLYSRAGPVWATNTVGR